MIELTPARADVLTTLIEKPRCQRELAEVLCVTEGVISRLVRKLVDDGLVARHMPLADRRFRIVSLTDKGRALLHELTETEFPDDGRCSAQCYGESLWLADWERVLNTLELDYLYRIAEHDFVEDAKPDPPYPAMRVRARQEIYDDWFRSDIGLDHEWPWTVSIPAPPRLRRGLAPA